MKNKGAVTELDDAQSRVNAYVQENLKGVGAFGDWQKLLPGIEDLVDPKLIQMFDRLDQDRCKELIQVIKDRRDRLPLKTGYLDGIVGMCGQILAFGAAGLALAIGFADKLAKLTQPLQHAVYVLGVFYALLVLLSLVIIVMYLAQARFRYPFIYFERIGNTWPWFYYASISREVNRNVFQLARAKFRDAGLYAKDLIDFAEKVTTETLQQRARNELQQYFLLMAYSGYTQQFALRLANLFLYGLAGAALGAIVLSIVISRAAY